MGFFDDFPQKTYTWHRERWDPPVGELPHLALSDALLLAKTDTVAVAVTAIWAFRTGFEFWVSAQFRRTSLIAEDSPLGQTLHVGLQFADGRKVANIGHGLEPAGEPTRPILRPVGMGGGRSHRNLGYWVWPLPPEGPLSFVCEWSAFGIPETRKEVDGQTIADAARHSIELWPETTDTE